MKSRRVWPLIAIILAVFAMDLRAAFAQAQKPMPPLSTAKAQYFKDHPDEFKKFLDRLPQVSPAGPVPTVNRAMPPFGGSWTAVATAPGSGLSNPLLMHDGSVIVHVLQSQTWYKLTPDINGNYATGTWSTIATMPANYGPLYFASAVLPDGKVIMQGGEYNLDCTSANENAVWISLGAIYDPATNSWTSVNPPGGFSSNKCGNGGATVGDAQSIVLPLSGTFMLGACCALPTNVFLLNESNLTYSATGDFPYWPDEQGYTLLPNNNVLTIDVQHPPATHIYDSSAGTWSAAASTPASLVDPCGSAEIGPAVTRPDGTTVAFGGNALCSNGAANPTAIYTAATNTWAAGPNVPAASQDSKNYTLADAPAAMLPNGNILFAGSPGYGVSPTHFFEFTSANAMSQISDPIYNASSSASYYYNFLVLPNGQVLVTDFSNIAEVYSPTGSPNAAWRPTVNSVASCVSPNQSYVLNGTQLAGLSQGGAYGDDSQSATNYPVVRIVNNSTGHVFYATADNPSTLSIAPNTAGSMSLKVAGATELGASTLYVVANGIASTGTSITVSASCSATPTTTALGSSQNPSIFGQSVTFTATVTGSGGTPTGTVTFKDGATTLGTGTLSGGTATYQTSSLSVGSHTITAAYSGDTNFAASTSSGLSQTIDPPPSLQVSPTTDIVSLGALAGPFAPPSFQYQLSASNDSLNYSISGLPTWLDASSSSGTVTTSPTTITFTINSSANTLVVGTYNATITITNTTNGLGGQSMNATLEVYSGGGSSMHWKHY